MFIEQTWLKHQYFTLSAFLLFTVLFVSVILLEKKLTAVSRQFLFYEQCEIFWIVCMYKKYLLRLLKYIFFDYQRLNMHRFFFFKTITTTPNVQSKFEGSICRFYECSKPVTKWGSLFKKLNNLAIRKKICLRLGWKTNRFYITVYSFYNK